MRAPRSIWLGTSFLAMASIIAGCGHKLQPLGLTNQPPEIRLLPPVSKPMSLGDRFVHSLEWRAADPDGRIDHYLIAHDPASLERPDEGWSKTRETSQALSWRRVEPGAIRQSLEPGHNYDLFAVRAVDDRGAVSPPATRVYFGDNIAPTVRILTPEPSHLIEPRVPPSFHVHWEGSDPDGKKGLPRLYKFKLFEPSSFDLHLDSLAVIYGPRFMAWDSLPGDSAGVTLHDLEIYHLYLFVVTAIDEQGAYDPVFSRDVNAVLFQVGSPTLMGPVFTISNEFFNYSYPTGGFFPDPSLFIHADAPAGRAFVVNWSTATTLNATVQYRWAVDIADVTGGRWSDWNEATRSVALGPYPGTTPDEAHTLFVEALDSNGLLSLAVVRFHIVNLTFQHELLIVNDTRFQPDYAIPGPGGTVDSIAPPTGTWPTAAELDTFLFARGNVRWRMRPPGALSRPGLFAGYRFDTLGTVPDVRDPLPSLEILGQYRHIIWITDLAGSTRSTLGYMSSFGAAYTSRDNVTSTLAAYVQNGGSLWLAGGGCSNATLASWNNWRNDVGARIYTSSGTRPELVPGRFMFDLTHWRSEIRESTGYFVHAERSIHAGGPGTGRYDRLPSSLDPRTPASDPPPYYRYTQTFPKISLEVLSAPNAIGDPKNPSHRHATDIQALDTLYVAEGTDAPHRSPTSDDAGLVPWMTYYHGTENGSVVFSGFDIWNFRRTQCQQLVDVVLQDIWGLQKTVPLQVAATTRR
jgi:hypothetical protein